MTSATFRWRPSLFFATILLALPMGMVGVLLLTKASIALLLPLLAMLLLPLALVRAFRYRLILDEQGVTLLSLGRPYWTIPWSDLQEVTYQPGSLWAKNWDRLVLRTPTGVKSLTLDDRLSGRWSDSEAIKGLLRARGYAL